MFQERIRVRKSRVGVIIGENGELKKRIQDLCNVEITINGQEVLIKGKGFNLLRAKNFIKALNRGFSPKNAEILLSDDNYTLDIIDITDFTGKSDKSLRRVKGRIIGRGGSIRKKLESITGTFISVSGKTVSIIGKGSDLVTARRAIVMLIEGSSHSHVMRFVYKLKKQKEVDKKLNPYHTTQE